MNDFSKIDSETEIRDFGQAEIRDFGRIDPQEIFSGNGSIVEQPIIEQEPYDGGGWPGDGSGTDDFADYNANEADDYNYDY